MPRVTIEPRQFQVAAGLAVVGDVSVTVNVECKRRKRADVLVGLQSADRPVCTVKRGIFNGVFVASKYAMAVLPLASTAIDN